MKINLFISQDIKTALSLPISADIATKDIIKLFMRHRKGFTLAETLITLTIIGVIAAMTVPTLVTNYTKQTYVTGLKKMYSQLQNAIKMMPITEGCSSGDYLCAGLELPSGQNYPAGSSRDDYLSATNALFRQFKVIKIVSFDETEHLNSFYLADNAKCAYLDDGSTICTSTGYPLPSIYVDVNGAKNPNKPGRDQFLFMIANTTKNGINAGTLIPYGSKLHSKYSTEGHSQTWYWKNYNYCSSKNVGDIFSAAYCTGRVLEEGKMDY